MKTVIFDIDGTLSDPSHRRHFLENKDWNGFFDAMGDDPLVTPVAETLFDLYITGKRIFLCTGRPETHRQQTKDWLEYHRIQYDNLLMRPAGDYRNDTVIKKEMLDRLQAEGHEILCVFDDRQSVVDMWRENGIICFQVNEGDFDKENYKQGHLTMMVGPSGAGKSTYIKQHFSNHQIISSDTLRHRLCGDFQDQSKNKQVFNALHALVKTNLDHGLNVVVDATNIRNADRRKIRDLCNPDTEITYVVINRPMEDKIRDGDWRNEVNIKGQTLIERHEEIFNNNKKDILDGDGDDRVTILIPEVNNRCVI